MKQTTAKCVEDVLRWMESNDHHKAAAEGFSYVDGKSIAGPKARMVLSGYHERLIIPWNVGKDTFNLYGPGGNFDTRMYRPNAKGRAFLKKMDKLKSKTPSAPHSPQ